MSPQRSWVAKWQRVGMLNAINDIDSALFHNKRHSNADIISFTHVFITIASFVPGAYAIRIEAKMPEDIVEQLEENGIRIPAVLATSEAQDE